MRERVSPRKLTLGDFVMATWQSSEGSRGCGQASQFAQYGEWPQWQCGHCGTGNWENYGKQGKQCRSCGCKKSYSQTVKTPNKGSHQWHHVGAHDGSHGASQNAPPTQQRKSVTTMLEEVAVSLSAAAGGRASVGQPHGGHNASVQPSAYGSDRTQLQEEIKALQSALDLVPDVEENDVVRSTILAKIESKKAAIIASKPLGARIDGCRAALERAQSRKSQAEKSLTLAQAAVQQADAEVANLAQQLQHLEQEVAPQSEPAEQANSIESMAAAMSKIMADMKASPLVAPEVMLETETHMTNLLKGVRSIVAATVEAAAAVSQAPTQAPASKQKAADTGIQRRVKGKTATDDTTFTEGIDTGPSQPTDTGCGMSDGPSFR